MASFSDLIKTIEKQPFSVKLLFAAFIIILLFFYYILIFVTIPSGNLTEIIKLLLINGALTAILVYSLIEETKRKKKLVKK